MAADALLYKTEEPNCYAKNPVVIEMFEIFFVSKVAVLFWVKGSVLARHVSVFHSMDQMRQRITTADTTLYDSYNHPHNSTQNVFVGRLH